MGKIHKLGDYYYIEFIARGLMYSQIAGKTEEEAIVLLNKVESQIAAGEALTTVRDIDIVVFHQKFLQLLRDQDTQKTLRRFEAMIHHFVSFLAQYHPNIQRLSQVTPVIVEGYKIYLAKSHKVVLVNFSLLLLREFLEYGIKIGFINDNPTWHINLLPWTIRDRLETQRKRRFKEYLSKGVSFYKTYQLMQFSDIAKMLYFSNLIPLTREDMYN